MPYSPRNIKIACNHAGLTHYGGVYFFHEFLRVLQFRTSWPHTSPTPDATVDIICLK